MGTVANCDKSMPPECRFNYGKFQRGYRVRPAIIVLERLCKSLGDRDSSFSGAERPSRVFRRIASQARNARIADRTKS